jgi:hypothetical protein
MLCLVRPKACKRCGGDLSLECDVYGVYVQCIQCGANWSGKDMISVHAEATGKDNEPAKIEKAKRLVSPGHKH